MPSTSYASDRCGWLLNESLLKIRCLEYPKRIYALVPNQVSAISELCAVAVSYYITLMMYLRRIDGYVESAIAWKKDTKVIRRLNQSIGVVFHIFLLLLAIIRKYLESIFLVVYSQLRFLKFSQPFNFICKVSRLTVLINSKIDFLG